MQTCNQDLLGRMLFTTAAQLLPGCDEHKGTCHDTSTMLKTKDLHKMSIFHFSV